jgi:hypothetical protein
VAWWAEDLGLLDEEQARFRKGKSTADVVQMTVRMQEYAVYLKRRMELNGNEGMNEGEWPVARLLDLKKAYLRVNKPGLWKLLERNGMKRKCFDTIVDLHESTVYKVRGKEGVSKSWVPARGLREGCPTSPILINLYHQAVMRQAQAARGSGGEEVGVMWR